MADVTEREAFGALLNALQTARDSARAIGLLRSDPQWIRVAGLMDQVRDNSTKLMTASKRNAQGLILPISH